MAKKSKGWKKEPARHSLAARGVKTGSERKREAKQHSVGHYPIDGKDNYAEELGSTVYFENSRWVCNMRGKDIHLGMMVEYIDGEENSLPHPEGYPVAAQFSIMVATRSLSPQFIEEHIESGLGPEDVLHPTDVYWYDGGVSTDMEGITSPADKTGVESKIERGVRWFKSQEDALRYTADIHEGHFDAVFGLIGFILDRPYNMVGNTGWDIIAHQAFNRPVKFGRK